MEDVCFWSKATEDDLWFVDDDLLPSWNLAKRSGYRKGIDLYGDGSCFSRPTRRNTSIGTKDSVKGFISVPFEPLQVGATMVSELDHQMTGKTARRISIRKLLAWRKSRRGGRLLGDLWCPFSQM